MECSDSTRETCKTKSKRKKDYLPLPFLGMEVGGDGGGLFWLMMEREKEREGETLVSNFFSALGEVRWVNGHTASQPASQRAIKSSGWLSLFFGQGKSELGALGLGPA